MSVLVRHFFGRFFDNEIVSPQGEILTNVTQTLALLATPGLLVAMYLLPHRSFGWTLVADRYFFVTYSMIVMGFVMVFEWDALFPDRRDYLILRPLPIPLAQIFAAKVAALLLFLALFTVDINLPATLLVPLITGGSAGLCRAVLAHAAGVIGGGAFMALVFAGLQGILINVLGARAFRRVSPIVQMLAMGALVVALLLSPLVAASLRALVSSGSPLLYWFPCFWFLGLYDSLQPAGPAAPVFSALAGLALRGLLWAAVVTLAGYAIGYRRHARRVIESLETGYAGPGRLRRAAGRVLSRFLLRHPIQRAAFYFIGQTITRNTRHQLFLATYCGVGVALAVLSLAAGETGRMALPLTLSFFLVSGLRAAFNLPAELHANWAFRITESECRNEHLAGARKWVVLCGVLPLFAALAPFEFSLFPWTAALFHLAFGVTLSLVLVQVMFHTFRKVPFTCSYFPGKMNMMLLSLVYLFGFTTYSWTMVDLERALLRNPERIPFFFLAAAAAIILLSRRRDRELKQGFLLAYEEAPDPIVRTLNLT